MGWCCSQKAHETMQKIEQRCWEVSGRKSNVYTTNGRWYFHQTNRRSHADGGITGTIHIFTNGNGEPAATEDDGTHVVQVSNYRIGGNGEVIRGPRFFKDAVKV